MTRIQVAGLLAIVFAVTVTAATITLSAIGNRPAPPPAVATGAMPQAPEPEVIVRGPPLPDNRPQTVDEIRAKLAASVELCSGTYPEVEPTGELKKHCVRTYGANYRQNAAKYNGVWGEAPK